MLTSNKIENQKAFRIINKKRNNFTSLLNNSKSFLDLEDLRETTKNNLGRDIQKKILKRHKKEYLERQQGIILGEKGTRER